MRISDWSSDVCSSDLHRLMHFAHARMGCIELVAQPLRSFAGGLGRDNGALAGPELGSERLGAHGSGQGQRPGRWRAPRVQGAGEEMERPPRRPEERRGGKRWVRKGGVWVWPAQ